MTIVMTSNHQAVKVTSPPTTAIQAAKASRSSESSRHTSEPPWTTGNCSTPTPTLRQSSNGKTSNRAPSRSTQLTIRATPSTRCSNRSTPVSNSNIYIQTSNLLELRSRSNAIPLNHADFCHPCEPPQWCGDGRATRQEGSVCNVEGVMLWVDEVGSGPTRLPVS